jgi:hypothetical protein
MTSIIEPFQSKIRKIMSRKDMQHTEIINSIEPGETSNGCIVCCAAPACCPLCTIFPCFGHSDYITLLRNSSTYIYIRENSIEWNEPEVAMQQGNFCGVDPCMYGIQDKINVVYFDDVMFENITDKTRSCNEFRSCLFGGKGERVRIDSPICCSCCQKASFPFLCVPMFCPKSCCPCMLRHEIYMKDAQKGLYDINKARENALHNPFYCNPNKKQNRI